MAVNSDKDCTYLSDESFLHQDDPLVFHGFFTRIGGISSAPCKGLNCGFGSDDDQANVDHNRGVVAMASGVNPLGLLSPYQVHGADVVYADAPFADRPECDSLITDKPGIALGILTADCAPVLFYAEKENGNPIIGAAHAGWKGALGGVLDNTMRNMLDRGAMIDTMRACIGPCIGRHSYEVDLKFADAFLEHNEEAERFFSAATKDGHLMFDLAGYCAWRLSLCGVSRVVILDEDTYKKEDMFFSYRRATHRSAADYGRQISVIAMKQLD